MGISVYVLSRVEMKRLEVHFPIEKEKDVLHAFLMFFRQLGFTKVLKIQEEFPDLVLVNERGNEIKAEVEFKSSNYEMHRHSLKGCELIICWEDDWKESPLPRLELNKRIKSPVFSEFISNFENSEELNKYKICDALSEPTRTEILQHLMLAYPKSLMITDLKKATSKDISNTTMYFHLRKLREAGLVKSIGHKKGFQALKKAFSIKFNNNGIRVEEVK